ncbi:putative endopolygalacturonase D [Glarea lozoyensis 74030]|uniref:endo-polygalacturonase n=1 Tax=Glarea lozoyensis (strain ATCC 74030 / MF5533) TaxID=1104152 RepID=H0EUK9_GLAL7|nr:putative endopolygalacturonase D [Glarea lozoyensis 74030]
MTNNSVISNLHIVNWPVHLFAIQTSSDVILKDMLLDNRDGEAPNSRSDGLAAAHNSDGYGVKESSNILITNNKVYNQDDCVAVTSGNNITIDGLYCSGGHGLSIGSVGGKSNNNVTNILFTNTDVVNSTNGPRIKSNFNTTGYIANITYSNIRLSNITDYGIDVQQDYLNGGPNGTPSNGVIIANVLFKNVAHFIHPEPDHFGTEILAIALKLNSHHFLDHQPACSEDGPVRNQATVLLSNYGSSPSWCVENIGITENERRSTAYLVKAAVLFVLSIVVQVFVIITIYSTASTYYERSYYRS